MSILDPLKKERKRRLENILKFINDSVVPTEENWIKADTIFFFVKIYADKINCKLNDEVITSGGYIEDEKRFPLGEFYELNKKSVKTETDFTVSLARDPVITNIWNSDRLVSSLNDVATIENPWQQDKNKHAFRLFLPMGLTEVFNGNHSTNSGIITGTGKLQFVTSDSSSGYNGEVWDLSHLYNDYYYDGYEYRSRSNSKIHITGSFESGCIFEIGRIIHRNEISFLRVISSRNRLENNE